MGPWVPRNPSIFEQRVPEPINFEPKKPNLAILQLKSKQKAELLSHFNITGMILMNRDCTICHFTNWALGRKII